jgi:hypothetical protein
VAGRALISNHVRRTRTEERGHVRPWHRVAARVKALYEPRLAGIIDHFIDRQPAQWQAVREKMRQATDLAYRQRRPQRINGNAGGVERRRLGILQLQLQRALDLVVASRPCVEHEPAEVVADKSARGLLVIERARAPRDRK